MARTQDYTFGRGELKFANFVGATQNPGAYRYIGNSPAFGFTQTVQEVDHTGSDHGVGELDFSIATSVNRAGSFQTDDVNYDNLALAFFGASQTATQTSATAVVEPPFVGVKQGYEYQLGITTNNPVGVRGVANVVVKVATVTKVLGTDYTVDLARGLIRISDGGGIANAASVDVTYDKVAGSYTQVISGSTPIEGALLYVADNPSGTNKDVLIPWARITPNGEFALKSQNAIQQLSFNLKVLKRAGLAAFYNNGQPA